MATTALKKITAEAKRIRKRFPKVKWSAAIKKASAKYRGSKKPTRRKVGAVRKKAVAKKAPRRVKRSTVKTVTVRTAKVSGLRELNLKYLYDDLAKYERMRLELKKKMREVPKGQKRTIEKTIRYYNRLISIQKRSIEMAKKV